MAFDEAQETLDFENIDLDIAGETVEYISSISGSKTILAVILRGDGSNRSGIKSARVNLITGASGAWKCELLVSKGAIKGIAKIVEGKDRVKFKLESSDTNPRIFAVSTSIQDYGCWRLGLLP